LFEIVEPKQKADMNVGTEVQYSDASTGSDYESAEA
jgi:hypothetical protein